MFFFGMTFHIVDLNLYIDTQINANVVLKRRSDWALVTIEKEEVYEQLEVGALSFVKQSGTVLVLVNFRISKEKAMRVTTTHRHLRTPMNQQCAKRLTCAI
jgi:hypothetical protein